MKTRLILFFLICASFGVMAQSSAIKVELIDGYLNKTIKTKIEKNISQLLNDLLIAYYDDSEEINYSGDGIKVSAKESIDSIWSSSKFYCTKYEIKERLLKTMSGYEIRNIPVKLGEQLEEIVLEIDNEGDIKQMFFSISQHQYKNVSLGNIVIDETRKNIIRDFLESLKTAYIKKDINFIDMVYSDKALIVVGKTVQKTDKDNFKLTEGDKPILYSNNSSTTYKKITKKEYLENLMRVFHVNKNILVQYENIDIMQHRKSGYESFYGVRLKQKWQSDNYSDYGLLFFVIQFRVDDYPLIWVRVWQDANTTSISDQIGFGEILIQPN